MSGLPGGDYNTALWIPQGRPANDKVIGSVSRMLGSGSGTLARSNEPINRRRGIAGEFMVSCAG